MMIISIFQHGIGGDFFLCYLVGLGETLCRWSRPWPSMHFMFILKVNIITLSHLKKQALSSWCTVTPLCHISWIHFIVSLYYFICLSSVILLSLDFCCNCELSGMVNCSILYAFRPCPALWDTGTNTEVLSSVARCH